MVSLSLLLTIGDEISDTTESRVDVEFIVPLLMSFITETAVSDTAFDVVFVVLLLINTSVAVVVAAVVSATSESAVEVLFVTSLPLLSITEAVSAITESRAEVLSPALESLKSAIVIESACAEFTVSLLVSLSEAKVSSSKAVVLESPVSISSSSETSSFTESGKVKFDYLPGSVVLVTALMMSFTTSPLLELLL